MPNFTLIDPSTATGKTQELFSTVQANMGMIPNMTRGMANSPAVLGGYLGLAGALAHGSLPPQVRGKLALVVAQENSCDYCLAAHTAIGGMLKIGAEEMLENRQAHASDAKTQAALQFAHALLETRGHVSESDMNSVRAAGYSDGEIAEIVAHVALNIFTNYFNVSTQTEIDFPAAPKLEVMAG